MSNFAPALFRSERVVRRVGPGEDNRKHKNRRNEARMLFKTNDRRT